MWQLRLCGAVIVMSCRVGPWYTSLPTTYSCTSTTPDSRETTLQPSDRTLQVHAWRSYHVQPDPVAMNRAHPSYPPTAGLMATNYTISHARDQARDGNEADDPATTAGAASQTDGHAR